MQQTKRNSCQGIGRDEMPRTRSTIRLEDLNPTEIDEIHVRILDGGSQLALLIGKDFPVADEIWPEVNQFHRMIDGYKLNDTWVTMVTPDEREVSNFALAFFLSFFVITESLFGRLYCRPSSTVL